MSVAANVITAIDDILDNGVLRGGGHDVPIYTALVIYRGLDHYVQQDRRLQTYEGNSFHQYYTKQITKDADMGIRHCMSPDDLRDLRRELINLEAGGKPFTPKQRILDATNLLFRYSQIDGAHHKAWCIDQAVRILMSDKYESWVESYETVDEDGEKEYEWDVGICP
jgi:hypothetical protein